MSFRANMRAAAGALMVGYAAAQTPPVKLQWYPGRPAVVKAPCGFVDRIVEGIAYTGPTLMQRRPTVEVVLLHGLFDSKEAVDQADAFVDGFLAYVADLPHAAGANTIVGVLSVEDDPTYVNDWVRPEEQRVWYATRIALEGLALGS